MRKILRALLIVAAALYALALVYVLFFWSRVMGYDSGRHSLNLSPLAGIAAAYLSGDGLARSQFMLNILLFVPLGFFPPLLFPRRAGALWQTAFIALSVTLAAETIQYFIGRSADIDDVIANFAGGVAGYALYTLAQALFCRFAFWKALSKSEKRAKPSSVLAAVLALFLIFGLPFALDSIDAQKPYGLFRYTATPIPASASIRCDLDGAVAEKEPVYIKRTGLQRETADKPLALFPAPEGARRDEWDTSGAFGGAMLSVVAPDGSYRLDVYGDGGYYLTIAAGEGAYPEDTEGFGAWVESFLPQLAPAGVTLSLAEVRERGGSDTTEENAPAAAAPRAVTARADAKAGDAECFVSGCVYLWFSEGELTISSSLVFGDPAERVQTITAGEALRAARGMNDWYDDVEITSVELVFREVNGVFLPCYAFEGMAKAKSDGQTVPFQSVVDAVRR